MSLTQLRIARSVSGTNWTNPQYAGGSDNHYATYSSSNADLLTCSDFGFTIPDGAVIEGVKAYVEGHLNTGDGFLDAYMVRGGRLVGDSRTATGTLPTGTDGTITFGGPSDLWGSSLSVERVNASDFGVALSPDTNAGADTISVDCVWVEITYTPRTTYSTGAVRKRPSRGGPDRVDTRSPVNWSHPLNQGLLSWWLPLPNNQGGGKLFDLCGNNPLTMTGTYQWAPGRTPFSGIKTNPTTSNAADGYAITTSPRLTDNIRNAFTVSVWTKGAAENNWPSLSGSVLHISSYFTGARTVYIGGSRWASPMNMGVYIDNAAASVAIDWTSYESDWHHIVATYDKTTLRLYVDGNQVGSTAYSATLEGPSDYIVIGASAYTPDGWAGDITDARMMSRALSAAEVAALHAQCLRGHPDTLNRRGRTTFLLGSPADIEPKTSVVSKPIVRGGPDRVVSSCPVNWSHPLTKRLLSWWMPLQCNAGGTILFDLCGRNHGTLTGGPTWVPGPKGFRAIDIAPPIPGSTYVLCPSIPASLSRPFTVIIDYMSRVTWEGFYGGKGLFAWTDSGGSNGIGIRHGFGFDGTETRLGYDVGGTVYQPSGFTTTVGARSFVAMVFVSNNGTSTIWASSDYPLKSTTFAVGAMSGTPDRFHIGTRLGVTGSHDGRIYSVMVLEGAATDAVVRGWYDQCMRGHPDTLRRYGRRLFQTTVSDPVVWDGAISSQVLLNSLYSGRYIGRGATQKTIFLSSTPTGGKLLQGQTAPQATIQSVQAPQVVAGATTNPAISVTSGSSVASSPVVLARRPRVVGPDRVITASPIEWGHPLNQGLVSWWMPLKHNGGGTTLFDLCGRNHGTLTNGPTWTAGPNGFGALSFDGSNDYVDTSFNVAGMSALTISAHVMSTASASMMIMGTKDIGGNPTIFNPAPGGDTGMGYWDGGQWRLVGVNRDIRNDYTWHHVVGQFLGGQYLRIYIDGVLDSSGNIADTVLPTNGAMTLGAWHYRPRYLTGRLQSVAVYNRALSASEVALLYEQILRGHPDTLRRSSRKAFFVTGSSDAPPTIDGTILAGGHATSDIQAILVSSAGKVAGGSLPVIVVISTSATPDVPPQSGVDGAASLLLEALSSLVGSVLYGGGTSAQATIQSSPAGRTYLGGHSVQVVRIDGSSLATSLLGGHASGALQAIGAPIGAVTMGGRSVPVLRIDQATLASLLVGGHAPASLVGTLLPDGHYVVSGASPVSLQGQMAPSASAIGGGHSSSSLQAQAGPSGTAVGGGHSAANLALDIGPAGKAIGGGRATIDAAIGSEILGRILASGGLQSTLRISSSAVYLEPGTLFGSAEFFLNVISSLLGTVVSGGLVGMQAPTVLQPSGGLLRGGQANLPLATSLGPSGSSLLGGRGTSNPGLSLASLASLLGGGASLVQLAILPVVTGQAWRGGHGGLSSTLQTSLAGHRIGGGHAGFLAGLSSSPLASLLAGGRAGWQVATTESGRGTIIVVGPASLALQGAMLATALPYRGGHCPVLLGSAVSAEGTRLRGGALSGSGTITTGMASNLVGGGRWSPSLLVQSQSSARLSLVGQAQGHLEVSVVPLGGLDFLGQSALLLAVLLSGVGTSETTLQAIVQILEATGYLVRSSQGGVYITSDREGHGYLTPYREG
jgi:hypothetical protein